MPAAITVSASSATTKTMPLAQTYRSRVLLLTFDSSLAASRGKDRRCTATYARRRESNPRNVAISEGAEPTGANRGAPQIAHADLSCAASRHAGAHRADPRAAQALPVIVNGA